jgi:hypothetical protein
VALTARQLNRATLARQLLLRRERLPVADAVRRIVALQAQEPASPYLALWNRLVGFDTDDLTTAFARHRVVKATLMRITLHAVHAGDYPSFRHAMESSLRASRLYDRRFKGLGLSHAEADALVPDLVAFTAEPRSNAEVEGWVRDRIGDLPPPGVWWALRTYGPFVHAPTGGAWAFGPRPAYRAAPAAGRDPDPAVAARHLIRRYLEGFGPASVADIAQFTMLKRAVVRAATAAMTGHLRELGGPDGTVLLDVPDAAVPDPDTPAPPRLMAMWDSVLLAYADRGRLIPPAYRSHVTRQNGDVLPTVLVDGLVAGVWRAVDGGIRVGSFRRLSDGDWQGLAGEAGDLIGFLADRDPSVYRRYGHWWDKGLPIVEDRMLAEA